MHTIDRAIDRQAIEEHPQKTTRIWSKAANGPAASHLQPGWSVRNHNACLYTLLAIVFIVKSRASVGDDYIIVRKPLVYVPPAVAM